ncbi:unnamed protein product [Chilo suppressalis]|uniref:Uncharacterized protein n=1 Tax=Chilo suppressalis TaxID=168631 RepID=A0ABN8B799_CHISP|nr:unnamed protein product [Chilo suppressalis]
MITAKQEIYTHVSLNVFLYNLPAYLVRLVRLRNGPTLEDALKIVLKEQNFQTVYDYKNRNIEFGNLRYNNNYQYNNQRQPIFSAPNRPHNSNFSHNFNNRPQYNNSQNNNDDSNFRTPNNNFTPNSFMQSRNSFRSNITRPSQWQQPAFNRSTQNQQFADNAPRNTSSPYVGSGSNTDVTMRTASSRRINFIDSEFVNNDEPVSGSSGEPDIAENFCVRASPIEKP